MSSTRNRTDQASREAVIDVENLVTHYGERKILDGVSLQVQKGEILVIMGGSGSGKSTLLRHLLGLHHPTSGAIRLLGTDVATANQKKLYEIRRNIGVAFQKGCQAASCPSDVCRRSRCCQAPGQTRKPGV